MRGTRGVLHNLSILSLGQVLSQLINVWALVFLADHLGAHWFGVVQIGVTFMAYALITAEWGMMSLGIREISRLDDLVQVDRYARVHLGLMTVQACVVLALGLLVLPHLPFHAEDPLVFTLYLLVVLPQIFMVSWVAMGMERMTWVGATKTGRALFYALFVLLLLRPLERATGLPGQQLVPLLFLAATLGGNLVIGIPLARWFGRPLWPARPPLAEARRRWREAAPIGAGILVLRVLLNIDIVMLGLRATPEVAGGYAAASRIIFLLVVAVDVLWAALLPRFSRLAKLDPPGFVRAFNLYLGFVLAGLLPVAVGGVLVGPALIKLFYGGQFPEAGRVFQVLSVSYTMLAVGTFLGNTLVSEDRQARYVPPVTASALVAFVGTFLLIPRLGGVGACLGMLASHALLVTWVAVIVRRRLRRRLGQALLALVPALGALVLVVLATAGWHVVPRILLGGISYLALAAWPLRRLARDAGPATPPASTPG
ncbi:MAG: oligosaccharide flippase family protein [Candidatus Krumholzibacteriia bacterium]